MAVIFYYLYKVINIVNKKVYIGQTINPEKRWRAHKYNSRNISKRVQYFNLAMNKYGVENFIYEIIAISKAQEDANESECILIKQYDSQDNRFGYNIRSGGNTSLMSESTIKKLVKQLQSK